MKPYSTKHRVPASLFILLGCPARFDTQSHEATSSADASGTDPASTGSSASDSADTSTGGQVECLDAGIGVPACDLYLDWYPVCIDDNLSGNAAEAAYEALVTTCDAWLKAAATPAGQEGLAQACLTASHAARDACGWRCADLGVGVSECDQYIADYLVCIDEEQPEAAQETSLKALESSCVAWWESAQTEEGQADLATACAAAAEAVAASCGWS